MEHKTKITAEEGKQDLIITREFDLPVALLFQAHQDAGLLEQWMGTKVLKLEIKNHGSYQFETLHNGKVVFRANGTIHQFVPGEKIVRTFEMENAPIGVQLEFLEFEKLTDSTSRLVMQIIYRSEEHRAKQLQMPFEYGINMAHQKLQELMSKQI